MNIIKTLMVAAICLSAGLAHAQSASIPLSRITTGAPDTPSRMGLLATAQAEAAHVERHVRYAASRTDHLYWMRTQASHVIHALEPDGLMDGRGLGFGLRKALAGISLAAVEAAGAPDATDGLKLHAGHVAASISGALDWSGRLLELARQVVDSPDPHIARPLVEEMRELTGWLLHGRDADKDGKTGWQKGEGGLDQVATHVGLMAAAQGR
jgi:hypothetical protein